MRNLVPPEFTIGESLAWEKSFSLYPASEWTLTYYFRGAGPGFNAVATADGDTHVLAVAKTATAAATAGRYSFQAFAEKGTEKILVDAGDIMAYATLATLDTTEEVDPRSEAQKILDVIDARLSGDISRGVMEYQIGDRQLKRYSLKELVEVRKMYAGIVARERRALSPDGLFKNHHVRFRRPQ